MRTNQYEITTSVTGFTEGDILDVTARFGDWHTYDLQLEPSPATAPSKKVVVTETPTGFTEAEILDPTARFGDWHTFDLAFEPTGTSTPESIDDAAASPGPIRLTMDQFQSIAAPIDAEA